MILRHDFAAMNALLWGETSNPDWSALVSGATSPDPLPPLAEKWIGYAADFAIRTVCPSCQPTIEE